MKLPPKCIFSALRALGVFIMVARWRVIKFWSSNGGVKKNIAEVLSEIHEHPPPPIPKKMVNPLMREKIIQNLVGFDPATYGFPDNAYKVTDVAMGETCR